MFFCQGRCRLWLPHRYLWGLPCGFLGTGTLFAASGRAQLPAVPFSAFPEGMLWERRDVIFLSRMRSLGSTLLNCSFSLSLPQFSVALYLVWHQLLSSDLEENGIEPRSALRQSWCCLSYACCPAGPATDRTKSLQKSCKAHAAAGKARAPPTHTAPHSASNNSVL